VNGVHTDLSGICCSASRPGPPSSVSRTTVVASGRCSRSEALGWFCAPRFGSLQALSAPTGVVQQMPAPLRRQQVLCQPVLTAAGGGSGQWPTSAQQPSAPLPCWRQPLVAVGFGGLRCCLAKLGEAATRVSWRGSWRGGGV